MSAAGGTDSFEIALVGDFQCGKSTTFNAILGRSLSPCGIGVKTSACAVTATALCPGEPAEYAEPIWRKTSWLESILDDAGRTPGDDEPWRSESPDLERAAALIRQFGKSPELAALRFLKRVPIDRARHWTSYPLDWEARWLADPSGGGFSLEDVLPVFLESVVFHIHSEFLERLDCDLTDAPGFGTGPWDTMLSREACVRADMVVCVLDGRQSTIQQSCADELGWILHAGLAGKVLLIQNGMGRECDEMLARTNAAILRQRGFPVPDGTPICFDARSAQADCDFPERQESGIYTMLARISDEARAKRKDASKPLGKIELASGGNIAPVPGYEWAVPGKGAFSWLMGGVRWNAGIEIVGQGGIVSSDKEGQWRLRPGYSWGDTGTREERKSPSAGARWFTKSEHPDDPHITSTKEKDHWQPDPGYVWADDRTDRVRSGKLPNTVWRPGIRHRDKDHYHAARTEGDWDRDETRKKEEVIPLVQRAKHDKFFTGSGIPRDKLSNARASMRVPASEEVFALYDDTIWGGSREGILVTSTGVFAKQLWEEPHFWKWNDIRSIEWSGDNLVVNGENMTMPIGSSDKQVFADNLAKVIRRLAK